VGACPPRSGQRHALEIMSAKGCLHLHRHKWQDKWQACWPSEYMAVEGRGDGIHREGHPEAMHCSGRGQAGAIDACGVRTFSFRSRSAASNGHITRPRPGGIVQMTETAAVLDSSVCCSKDRAVEAAERLQRGTRE
jgi:hypothetical protein